MPGVLIIEALAQVGAAAILAQPGNKGKLVLFAGIDKVRFKKEVRPGDQLVLRVKIARVRGRFGKGLAEAVVDRQTAAAAELTFMLSD